MSGEFLVNWSHKSDRVRLKVPVRVPHDSDLDQALALMREAASYPERVLAVPAPNALIMAFGETAIELELRFWIEDAQNGVHNVKSQVLYEIWRLFSAARHSHSVPQARSLCTLRCAGQFCIGHRIFLLYKKGERASCLAT